MKNTKHNRCGERGGTVQKYTKYLFRRNQFYGNSVFIATKSSRQREPHDDNDDGEAKFAPWIMQSLAFHNVCECVCMCWGRCGCLCVSVCILKCFLCVPECVCICVRECLNVHENVVSQEKKNETTTREAQRRQRDAVTGNACVTYCVCVCECVCLCGLFGVWVELLN